MLTPREAAAVRQAVQHPDDSVAQVVADSLVERNALLGELMQVAMQRPRNLARERELVSPVVDALRETGLAWAREVAFERGLPVAARGEADRFMRLATNETKQWPLEELWLEGGNAGIFYEALRSPVLGHVTRLALDGGVMSPYSTFVDGPPEPLAALPSLTWLKPPRGTVPRHWRPVLLPVFANLEVLCVDAGVELEVWLDAMPALKTLELRVTRPDGPHSASAAWVAALFATAQRRKLPVFVEGLHVESMAQLTEHGLTFEPTRPDPTLEPSIPPLDEEREGSADRFIEAFDGQTVVLATPKSQRSPWAEQTWRSELHRCIDELRRLGSIPGVARVKAASSNAERTKITLEHPLKRLVVRPERADALAVRLRLAVQQLAPNITLPAITEDMLYERDGELVLLPLYDAPIDDTWRSEQRVVGLPLLLEQQSTRRGVESLVATVEREWRTGHSLAPTAFNELSLRRAWLALRSS